MIRRRSYVAILGVGLVVATMTSAQAQSWNLYNGYTSLPAITFAGGPMSSTNAATVDLEVGAASSPTPFVMDTGSTGIVVTPDHFTRGPNDVYVGQGSQTYTSSGIIENGSFYLTNVVIYKDGNTPLATARVTVLDVTSETCLPNYPNCNPNPHPTGVAYMGVGFDRGSSSTQPPAPYNNTNPFINIVSLASGQPVSSLAPGYIITNGGVTLGLSSSATNNFAFVKLLPNTTNSPPQPAPAWMQAPVTVSAGGKQNSGVILPDSGIDYAYLTPPPGASITTTTTNPSCKSPVCLQSNNTIQVYLPGQTSPQPAFYTFTTGATGNALQPNTVSVNPANTTAFLNTGREFYGGFDYVYDPIGGYIGYRWNGMVSNSFGEVTPSAALTGNVNLPAGFTSSLPTILYGATTLLEAGTGTISNTISGSFGLTIGSGQVILTGANTYMGDTTVNAGTLEVDGSIIATSSVTVNSGGTLSGTGVVDPLTVTIANGAKLSPGSVANPTGTLTIVGNLVFQTAAVYFVTVSGANASKTNVSGTASLAGTVQAAFPSGPTSKSYDILHTGGLGGTTFSGATSVGPNYTVSLSYTPTDVLLNVTAQLGVGTSLNVNQSNVASALNNFLNSGGTLPPSFAGVFGLSGGSLGNALSQLSGEAGADGQFAAFQLMNEFLNLMLDPFVNGRLGGGGGEAMGFAPDEQATLPPDIALAYAGVLKAPPVSFAQRWTAWGASFGGSTSTNGDPTVGSHDVTAQTFGFAGGMDYHYSPDTIFGFALAGAGTNWGLSSGLGTGRSDAFQAGVYGITRAGPAYLAAALAFTNHWMTTNRTALGDQLTASFAAQSYGGRVETGYRFGVLPTLGVTPYAALQAQDFHTPSYSETDVTGGSLGLAYNAMNATDVRSELGARFDNPIVVGGMPLLLRSRLAWAHDWVSNPSMSAIFESLPGASFVVNGAPMPQNSMLATSGAELFITPHMTLLAKFDSEFANGSQTYGGSGTLRYTW
jgi:autotransporter-associated beta strand protein